MDGTKRQDFQTVIRSVVRQRSTRYTSSHNLSLRWEEDDSSAVNDAANFQAILGALQLSPAREVVVSSTDNLPGWTMRGAFLDILSELELVGRPNSGKKTCNADQNLVSLVLHDDMIVPHVDVLFIFDCCYGYVACRAAEPSPRIVEFIAATEPSSPLALAPPRNTVTNKLLGEIKRRQREGYYHVEIADVVESLRSREAAVKRPTHGLKVGANSICLPFSRRLTLDPTRNDPALKAVFSVHLLDDMSKEEKKQFVDWLRTLPPRASMTLEGIYPTGSTCLIMTSAWGIWSKLAGMKGFKHISDITGPNTLSHRELLAVSSSASQENVPFSSQKGPSAKPCW
ncbi:hypothetical protein BDW62DRAFT_215766 [Aspergillus aurantiobrunneus]